MNPSTTAAPRPKKRPALIFILAAGAVGACGLLTLLAAIAVPKLLKTSYKSKQAEARYTLKTVLTSEEWFRQQQGHWATNPRELVEYANSSPRSYTCFLSPTGSWGGRGGVTFDQLSVSLQARLRQNETAADAQQEDAKANVDLTIVCAANLDEDPALDVWSLSASDPTPRQEEDDTAK